MLVIHHQITWPVVRVISLPDPIVLWKGTSSDSRRYSMTMMSLDRSTNVCDTLNPIDATKSNQISLRCANGVSPIHSSIQVPCDKWPIMACDDTAHHTVIHSLWSGLISYSAGRSQSICLLNVHPTECGSRQSTTFGIGTLALDLWCMDNVLWQIATRLSSFGVNFEMSCVDILVP